MISSDRIYLMQSRIGQHDKFGLKETYGNYVHVSDWLYLDPDEGATHDV